MSVDGDEDDGIFSPEEAAALGEKGRRKARWAAEHPELPALLDALRRRFAERHAGSAIDLLGDGFRYRVYVRDLTLEERSHVTDELGEAVEHLELVGVRYSTDDLRRVAAEVTALARSRSDGEAYSGASVSSTHNAVEVVVRPDAPALWEAVRERFGDAVRVGWEAHHYGSDVGPLHWDEVRGVWRLRG